MTDQQSSYRQIMKATSIFGGVQVFNILIRIIKSKFIAILLGPAGMGIAGLLTSTIGLISGLTNFGLGTSSVKNVAEANASGNQTRVAVVVTVMRRWVWLTGLLGVIVTIITAPLLSRITFGNNEYTLPFIWISISLLFTQLSSGQMVLLQGLRKLKYLAKANLAGSILGLLITIPLYYLFGIKGIVPAIIVTSLITLAGSWYFARKVKIAKVKVSKTTTIAEGKEMLTMGFMISLSGLITAGASYLIRIFISYNGSLDDVGLYNAGFTIINTYLGLIFTAMAADYYPRLSEVANNRKKCNKAINQQAEISILILTPIVVFFLVFIRWMVIVLYSTKFITIDSMIHWAALGMLFKATSWSISFVFMAKGDAKLFFWNELIANSYFLIVNIIGYYFYGLAGLGISYIVGYLLYLIQVYIITKIKYKFYFQLSFIRIFLVQLFLTISCFIIVRVLFSTPQSYYIGTVILLISLFYSLNELNKRLGLKTIITSILKK